MNKEHDGGLGANAPTAPPPPAYENLMQYPTLPNQTMNSGFEPQPALAQPMNFWQPQAPAMPPYVPQGYPPVTVVTVAPYQSKKVGEHIAL